MWADYHQGTLPTPDLLNLDVYEEIGLELFLEGGSGRSGSDYPAAYLRKIEERRGSRPAPADGRLSRNGG
jgi:hypothetical protein